MWIKKSIFLKIVVLLVSLSYLSLANDNHNEHLDNRLISEHNSNTSHFYNKNINKTEIKYIVNYAFLFEDNFFNDIIGSQSNASSLLVSLVNTFNGHIHIKSYINKKMIFSDYFQAKNIDMMVLEPWHYFNNKKKFDTSSNNYWSVSFKNNKDLQYYLVTKNDKKQISFKESLGSLSLKEHSFSAYMWINNKTLRENHKQLEKKFNIITYEKEDSTALLKVFFNKSNFAVVSKVTWDRMLLINPKIEKSIHIVSKSKNNFLPFIGFFKKGTNQIALDNFFSLSPKIKTLSIKNKLMKRYDLDYIYKLEKKELKEFQKKYTEYTKLLKKYN